ncbi:MAG: NUDIX hydrolase [Myxococcota bacterium]
MIRSGARVLVIRRSDEVPFPNYWSPVSGKMGPGERQDEAVVREVREELGVAVVPVRKVWECTSSDGAYWLHWWIADLADEAGGLVPNPREVSEVRWIRPGDYRTFERVFDADLRFFEEVLPALLD